MADDPCRPARHPRPGPRRRGGHACPRRRGRPPAAPTASARPDPREREVAQLLTRGAGTDEIAGTLVISPHTVKDHVKAVLAKVGVTSRTELSAKLFHEHVVSRLDRRRAREFAPPQPA